MPRQPERGGEGRAGLNFLNNQTLVYRTLTESHMKLGSLLHGLSSFFSQYQAGIS